MEVGGRRYVDEGATEICGEVSGETKKRSRANAELIIVLRNALPDLLTALSRLPTLEQENAELVKAVSEMQPLLGKQQDELAALRQRLEQTETELLALRNACDEALEIDHPVERDEHDRDADRIDTLFEAMSGGDDPPTGAAAPVTQEQE
jgi:hypothetical protein